MAYVLKTSTSGKVQRSSAVFQVGIVTVSAKLMKWTSDDDGYHVKMYTGIKYVLNITLEQL